MSFLDRPIAVLKMGMRQHEVVLAPLNKSLLSIMQKYDWTCHRCGVRIPNFMQLDHTKGHGNPDPAALRPICVFCHDQDHIIWAAARARVIPIIAPDMTNEQISRLTWTVIGLRAQRDDENDGEEINAAIQNLMSAFKKRSYMFNQVYGSTDADSAIEAIYRFRTDNSKDDESIIAQKTQVAEKFFSDMRFIPQLLVEEKPADISMGISVWGIGGFLPPAQEVQEAIKLYAKPADVLSAVSMIITEE